MNQITLSAIITGFPPELKQPKPLPGENLAQMVIRTHPQEWRNCVENLKNDFRVPEDICMRLRRGETNVAVDSTVQSKLERFINLRLPTHGRTLWGLAEIRDELLESGDLCQLLQMQLNGQMRLNDIIWPRQKDPSGDLKAEKFAASLGVTVITTEEHGPMDLGSLMKHVHGDYLWILPGGSRLCEMITTIALARVIHSFQEKPELALYSDQCYSTIFRTKALRTLMASGKTLSAEVRDIGRMLQEAGFELAADNDPIHRLVDIEPLYGGKPDHSSEMGFTQGMSSLTKCTSWWQRLLGFR